MVPPPRNRYADLLRVLAIGMVVLGHWLLTSISYRGGRLSGIDALAAYRCGAILTLAASRLASGVTVAERPV